MEPTTLQWYNLNIVTKHREAAPQRPVREEATMGSKVVLEVPEGVPEEIKRKAYDAAVLTLWEEGAISSGVAAAELGLTHHDFLDLLASKGIPIVRRPPNLERIKEAGRKLSTDNS
jgi:hypothetical protein